MSSHAFSKAYYLKFIKPDNRQRLQRQTDLKKAFVPQRATEVLTYDQRFDFYWNKLTEEENKEKLREQKRQQKGLADKAEEESHMLHHQELAINENFELDTEVDPAAMLARGIRPRVTPDGTSSRLRY
jgi:hypothetical protein